MSALNHLKFRLVRSIGAVLHHAIPVLDLRRNPIAGQVELLPKRTVHWDRSNLTLIGREPFWWHQDHFDLDAAFRVELADAEMIGKGVVVTRSGEAVLESTLFERSYLRRSHMEHSILFRRWMRPHRVEHAVPLANYLDMSYYHWTLESIGRLAFVEERLQDRSLKVLIDGDMPKFGRDTISALFGTDADQVIERRSARTVMHRCLMVSNPHSRTASVGGIEVYAPEHIDWLNRTGRRRIGGLRNERINFIISRSKQPGRRITNEELLLERFPRLDFQRIVLEDLSVPQQIDLFAHAGVIVGNHGAGFTNIVYATDAAVIELFPDTLPDKNTACFTQIGSHLQLPHLLIRFTPNNPAWDLTLGEQEVAHIEAFLRQHGRLG